VPSLDQVAQVDACGQDLPYGQSEFETAGLTPVPSEVVGAPRIAEARICMECTTHQLISLGEQGSTLLLAEIRLFHIQDTLLDDHGCVDPHRFRALARMGGGRYAPVGDVFKVEE